MFLSFSDDLSGFTPVVTRSIDFLDPLLLIDGSMFSLCFGGCFEGILDAGIGKGICLELILSLLLLYILKFALRINSAITF